MAPVSRLLDEPTNHHDLDGIAWLEHLLCAETFAWLVVCHDSTFLSNVAKSAGGWSDWGLNRAVVCRGSADAAAEPEEGLRLDHRIGGRSRAPARSRRPGRDWIVPLATRASDEFGQLRAWWFLRSPNSAPDSFAFLYGACRPRAQRTAPTARSGRSRRESNAVLTEGRRAGRRAGRMAARGERRLTL